MFNIIKKNKEKLKFLNKKFRPNPIFEFEVSSFERKLEKLKDDIKK
jgi:hypothetical protein